MQGGVGEGGGHLRGMTGSEGEEIQAGGGDRLRAHAVRVRRRARVRYMDGYGLAAVRGEVGETGENEISR
ncbi:hypothetical protein Scel_58070 [Streptomyces cellostaticus]|nr:hypothetical protein Scel_58070 [Streptomyces cellostaticus]